MTDRIKGFAVTLEKDIREDDAEIVISAILLLRGVAAVQPVKHDIHDEINRMKIRTEFSSKLYNALKDTP